MYSHKEWVSSFSRKPALVIFISIRRRNEHSFFGMCRYTADEDFVNADAVFDCIGDPPKERFDLAFCGSLLQKQLV